MDRIKEIIDYIKSKNIENWEVFIKKDVVTYIDVENSLTENIIAGNKFGLGIRVANNKKMGFANTDNIKNFKDTVDVAIKISKINEKDEDFHTFAQSKREYPNVKTYDKKLENFGVDEFHNFMETFDSTIRSCENKIETGKGTYRKIIENKTIINSEGIDIEEKSTSNSVFFEGLRLENKNENINLELGDADKSVLNAENMAKDFGQRIVSMKNKKDIKTKKMKILLHPECVGALFDEFINRSFSAENVQKKNSILFDKINKKIFDDKLNIFDDATADGLYDSRRSDDEGVPSKKIDLIKKGVIKNFIYNSYTAYKEGLNSTGHASRSPFSIPNISTTNIIMGQGKKDHLIKEMDEGIYVKNLMGIHTMNHSTGDFSLSVYEGHNVKKGSVESPLKDTMVSGNIIDLLNDIEEIGKKRGKFVMGQGSVYSPEILFSNIQVIGSK